MVKPFLSFVTRACNRPIMLEQNILSVQAQTCGDWEHIIIYDDQQRGMSWADKALDKYKRSVTGAYRYILDDDCLLLDFSFVAALRAIVESHGTAPDLIMVRSKRPPGPPSNETIFPSVRVWGGKVAHGTTNCLCYVMCSHLWDRFIFEFGTKPWGGDWHFLKAALPHVNKTVWYPAIVAEAQQLGRGRLFEPTHAGWFEDLAIEYGYKYDKAHGVWRATGV